MYPEYKTINNVMVEKETKNEVQLRVPLRIKDILAEKNMQLSTLAETLGVTRQALSRQVAGKMLVETAEKIAVALDVPLWQLFIAPNKVISQQESKTVGTPQKIGMIICPHCQHGIEITGVYTSKTKNINDTADIE